MKTNYLFLFVLFLSNFADAQYIAFPDATAHWSMRYYWSFEETNGSNGFYYEMNGDTIVDGTTYQKIYQSSDTWWRSSESVWVDGEPLLFPITGNYEDVSIDLIGLLRQDTSARKVYYRHLKMVPTDTKTLGCSANVYGLEDVFPFNEEILMYDFDILPGDTIYLGGNQQPYYITDISSVTYNDNVLRKVYHFNSASYATQFVEGLGSSEGLFTHFFQQTLLNDDCSLPCLSIEQEYLIGDGFYGCDSIEVLTVPIVDAVTELGRKFSLYPNPFKDHITLKLDFDGNSIKQGLSVNVFNQLGQVVHTQRYVESGIEILEVNTKYFPIGLYHITIYNDQQPLVTKRIIKTF